MDGIFIFKKKKFRFIILLLYGLLPMALYFILNIKDSEEGNEPLVGSLVFGILFISVAGFSMIGNRRSYLHIDEKEIHARYRPFGKLDCSMDEVAFVMPQFNTLNIMLKNRKRHFIIGLENSYSLSSFIRQRIYAPETESPEVLRKKAEKIRTLRKRELFLAIGGLILFVVNIFITVFLTGEREISEFGKKDQIIFACFCVIELLIIIGMFLIGERCGRYMLSIEQLQYHLKGAVIVSQSLPSGNIRKVYTDADNTGRLVLCEIPNDTSVYYYVQTFTDVLDTEYTSAVYANEDELFEENEDELLEERFSELIDITCKFRFTEKNNCDIINQ